MFQVINLSTGEVVRKVSNVVFAQNIAHTLEDNSSYDRGYKYGVFTV